MVKILRESMFVGDYELTISVETDLGLITLTTDFPRRNKWIGVRSVRYFEIDPNEGIDYEEQRPANLKVRNLQVFIHKLLMTAEFDYDVQDWQTWNIIMKYRREYGQT
jgi:hypothetical protein